MNHPLRSLTFVSILLLSALPAAATCGGGGGGGTGGAMPGGGLPYDQAPVYHVAWKVLGPGAAKPQAPEAALVLYWFPLSPREAQGSPLQSSRALSLAGARCVAASLVTPDNQEVRGTFNAPAKDQLVVLAGPDGAELGRVAAKDGKIDVRAVEKLLNGELDKREEALQTLVDGAGKKESADRDGAIADYRKVWDQRCLVPSLGRKAAKALKKLGVDVDKSALLRLGPDGLADPDVRGRHGKEVESTLRAGLDAEIAARYQEAGKLYARAVALDPADPTALRYLGELYRHQTGEWDKSRQIFERVLAQPGDPIARAVAMHGLGKMTIHAGRNAEGLALFQDSIAEFPLPITYRNLAVYWFSEKQAEKAAGFMRQALALAPEDGYNQIFAAVYLAAAGHKDEALKAARANYGVLEASYNLAAIYAQSGDRKKAMELLRRHFYKYERFDAVRAMEMQEARDDYMFASLHQDPEFIELTKLAPGHGMMMMGGSKTDR
ncbi:MAG: Tetratricopeptide repeat [Acidobacteriota bacterium]|jgi:tetratricopeptide (TPR) repeat protein|nr:Tetratricopeptide repeat [Acidobacteriota bacterium]